MAERETRVTPVLPSLGLLVLRLGMGGMMLVGHGLPKLARFDEVAAGFPDPIGLGREFGLLLVVLAEVPGAAMVMLGLGTRLAALPLAATVAVGAFVHHAGDPFSQREIALVHLVAYLTLLLTGPGRYSLDATIARLRRR